MSQKIFWLYVLKLEQGKYYVGVTSKTPAIRFKEHLIGGQRAARWTKKYKPLKIIDTKNLGYINFKEAEEYENKVVRKYIEKYGYNNVRGGDLSYSGDYIKRFGYYRIRKDWEVITVILFLVIVILYLGLELYIK